VTDQDRAVVFYRWPGVPAMFAVHDRDGNGLEIVEAT